MKSIETIKNDIENQLAFATGEVKATAIRGILLDMLDHIDRLNGRSDIMAEVAEGNMMIDRKDTWARTEYKGMARSRAMAGIETPSSVPDWIANAALKIADQFDGLGQMTAECIKIISTEYGHRDDISAGDPIVDLNSYNVPENLYGWVGRAYAPTFTRDMLRSVLAQLKLRGLLIVDFDALFGTREDEDSILSAVNLTPGTFAAINREDYPTAASPDQYDRMGFRELAEAIVARGGLYAPTADTPSQTEEMRRWLRDDDAIRRSAVPAFSKTYS